MILAVLYRVIMCYLLLNHYKSRLASAFLQTAFETVVTCRQFRTHKREANCRLIFVKVVSRQRNINRSPTLDENNNSQTWAYLVFKGCRLHGYVYDAACLSAAELLAAIPERQLQTAAVSSGHTLHTARCTQWLHRADDTCTHAHSRCLALSWQHHIVTVIVLVLLLRCIWQC